MNDMEKDALERRIDELCAEVERLKGTCHEVEDEDTGFIVCSECGAVHDKDYASYYCWCCGRKVVSP